MRVRMILNVDLPDDSGHEQQRELLERTAQFLQDNEQVTRTSGSIQECGLAGERLGRLSVISPVVKVR
jgi:hypothetical protein